ncbi:GNAT family N-acetyltransferase [Planomicrobium sp. YIM 101495]|uniref:GNAT family N-acetyltransferase n=1 Tax=Planomicrobium sp. YIM 101495 TaxID=2665160 RepID=UPI0012B6D97B|nr:GNAT family N-acetyltransferase [Planomicrobium sp. YIM 101495]MTD31475.1 GNAT family N-acetyltransferase [Planomicrobium sp. YIM 101495]
MAGRIEKIEDLQASELSKLVEESEAEGYRFVRRLVDQYEDGTNRFDQTGEILYGIREANGELVAIGGLNRDPYAGSADVGRLRRFYICEASRRQGIGTQLLEAIVAHARNHFSEVVVRTDSSAADAFYRANGFQGDLGLPEATHGMSLRSTEQVSG